MPGKVKPKEQEGNLMHQMRRRNTYYLTVVSLSIPPFPIPCLIFLSLFFDKSPSPIHLSRQARSPVLYLISPCPHGSSCLCDLSLVVQPKNRRERDEQRAGASSRSAPRPMRALAHRLVTGNAAQAETSSRRRRKQSYSSTAGLECRSGERRGEAMRGVPKRTCVC
ncbi:hypothetical protein EDB80DRAFT_284062 [Ilyonectria destructans]|nr:hypothetical protein EDB80DRAFT_284062 [Ilyonectria destructans]